MGKAEGEGCPKEGQDCPEESLWSQADEPCYEEETVGDDEGTVGGEEEELARTTTSARLAHYISSNLAVPVLGRGAAKLRITAVRDP